ncbi:hypothetical protein QZM46_15775 [Burkholderia vietnamiensis]|jgi:hypothetical protein|uniref:Uncharacterized protein n=2 Tax=Burkholderia vietnamiensis TaxID=60552 RepID=A0AAW7T0H1_BURVI|nr:MULTISPECIES: hypothetical protein [Burkholderia]MBE0628010.1 hypothetical protein [Burkholderia vietnamiensis]MBH9644261.1 hypothetical protein [Burkholderia vietnamiensis]MBJ9689528.1 hypothetical protein [Burkholderia vietnamiensis]MBR7907917.1 hypothetical protein [Burkholderia vietnamiensis]MBR7999775.1 hypothetical protein [Burkholderia vietnamiensis]
MLPATISVAGTTPIFGASDAADAAVEREEDELASDMRGSLNGRDAVEVARPAPVDDSEMDRRFINVAMLSLWPVLVMVNAGI